MLYIPNNQSVVCSTTTCLIPNIRSCSDWKMTNKTGMIKMPNATPKNIPPIAPEAMERLPCSVAPPAKNNGNYPAIKAKEVISMGRKRNAAPSMAASINVLPAWRRCSANSTIRIAFLANKPMSIISAICT